MQRGARAINVSGHEGLDGLRAPGPGPESERRLDHYLGVIKLESSLEIDPYVRQVPADEIGQHDFVRSYRASPPRRAVSARLMYGGSGIPSAA
jgi:hypothetical protein